MEQAQDGVEREEGTLQASLDMLEGCAVSLLF